MGGKDLGEVEGRETIIRIDCIDKKKQNKNGQFDITTESSQTLNIQLMSLIHRMSNSHSAKDFSPQVFLIAFPKITIVLLH